MLYLSSSKCYAAYYYQCPHVIMAIVPDAWDNEMENQCQFAVLVSIQTAASSPNKLLIWSAVRMEFWACCTRKLRVSPPNVQSDRTC